MANKETPTVETAPANCTGKLVDLPAIPGVTFISYQCQTCGQIVNVGYEDMAEHGLPTEHSPVLV